MFRVVCDIGWNLVLTEKRYSLPSVPKSPECFPKKFH